MESFFSVVSLRKEKIALALHLCDCGYRWLLVHVYMYADP